MKYQQKPQQIEAFTFPVSIHVSLPDAASASAGGLLVSAGDYLLIIDGRLSVMSKKEFHTKHDPVELTETRYSTPRERKPRKASAKRGLAKSVLEQHSSPITINGGVGTET